MLTQLSILTGQDGGEKGGGGACKEGAEDGGAQEASAQERDRGRKEGGKSETDNEREGGREKVMLQEQVAKLQRQVSFPSSSRLLFWRVLLLLLLRNASVPDENVFSLSLFVFVRCRC